jgi:hypothetical protein
VPLSVLDQATHLPTEDRLRNMRVKFGVVVRARGMPTNALSFLTLGPLFDGLDCTTRHSLSVTLGSISGWTQASQSNYNRPA